MTLAIQRPDTTIDPAGIALRVTGPDVDEADETCRRCGTNADVTYVGETAETIVALGETPGRKHSWHCHGCGHEWTTPVNAAASCPDGFAWCVRHETDSPTEEYHGAAYVDVVADRAGPTEDGTEGFVVTAGRTDVDGVAGEAKVYLVPASWPSGGALHDAVGFTPDAAREFAFAMLAAADAVRGAKRAEDLRLGDEVVIDGVEHVVTFLMMDACHGPDEACCDGTVQVFTDVSEAVDETEPAATFAVGEMVPLVA